MSKERNKLVRDFINNDDLREAVYSFMLQGLTDVPNVQSPMKVTLRHWIFSVDSKLPAEEYAATIRARVAALSLLDSAFQRMKVETQELPEPERRRTERDSASVPRYDAPQRTYQDTAALTTKAVIWLP